MRMVERLDSLPNRQLVELLNLYLEADNPNLKIYRNNRESVNDFWEGADPWGILLLVNGTKYNTADEWFTADGPLVSSNNPRALIPDYMGVLADMVKGYVAGDIPEQLKKALDTYLKDSL